MGHLQRNVDPGPRHHAAQTSLPRALSYFSTKNTGDTKRSTLDARTRLVEARFVQRYPEEVRSLFFFRLTLRLRRGRQQFESLSNRIGRRCVTKVAREAFRDDRFRNRRRRDHLPGSEMLETCRSVWDIRAANILAQQFSVRTNINTEIYGWLDVSNAINSCDLFYPGIVENAGWCFVGTPAGVAPFAFLTRRAIEPREIAESTTKNLYLVEEVERFETREHVALQAEPKRHHRHDHGDADDDAHHRQDCTQLRLAQVT